MMYFINSAYSVVPAGPTAQICSLVVEPCGALLTAQTRYGSGAGLRGNKKMVPGEPGTILEIDST